MNLPTKSKLLFIGDSITDAGRSQLGEAVAWEPNFGLGNGYVSMIYAWLGATFPEAAIRVVNKGTSGHTVRDLAARWDVDVYAEKPQTLCVMIGINDVWRQFDTPLLTEKGVGPQEYRETLFQLVSKSGLRSEAIHLASPFFIESNRQDAMRVRMDEYGTIVRAVAAETGAHFIDTQAAFDKVLAHCHSASLAWDRIHPGPVGHMILAKAFLESLGCL